jgi:hypothetical protein
MRQPGTNAKADGQIPNGEDIMKARRLPFAATIAIARCTAARTPPPMSARVGGQSNPTLPNVVPGIGNFAVRGKVQTLDPGASTPTLAVPV